MNDFEQMINGVTGICEANSFEKSCLWERWHTRGKWVSSNFGLGICLGKLDDRPVCISVIVDSYNDKKILFWHLTSEVCDYRMAKDWLNKKLPGVKMTDAQNFHIIA